jgi:hypothetical protein
MQCASRTIRFTDARSPHQMRCALERDHMLAFHAKIQDGQLSFHASGKHNGLHCTFQLVHEAARAKANDYHLFMQLSWTDTQPENHEHFLNSSHKWLDYWSRDLQSHSSASPDDQPSATLYQRYAAEVLNAEAQLADISFVQQQILSALRQGATYSTALKEGGTCIGYRQDRYYREDFGESDATQIFTDESSFLTFLRQFYDWETSKSLYPDKASEEVTWRLILHLLP